MMHHAKRRQSFRSRRHTAGARELKSVAWLLAVAGMLALYACEAVTTTDSGSSGAASEPTLALALDVKGATDLDDEAHAELKDVVTAELRDADALTHVELVPEGASDVSDGELQVRFALAPPDGAGEEIGIVIESRARGEGPEGELEVEASTALRVSREKGERDAAMRRRAVEAGVEKLAPRLNAAIQVRIVSLEALGAILTESKSPWALQHAAREVGRRRAKALAPELRALLVHPDDDVVLTTVAMLGQVGDTESVDELKDLTTSPKRAKVEQALYALGAIGGSEAEDALGETARSHPDPRIRQLATKVLADMLE